jgi:DNA-entry nuclease
MEYMKRNSLVLRALACIAAVVIPLSAGACSPSDLASPSAPQGTGKTPIRPNLDLPHKDGSHDDGTTPPPTAVDPGADYYQVTGKANIRKQEPAGTIEYSPLDGLGRSGPVTAAVTYRTMEEGKAGDRSAMQGICPSGWPETNPRVTIDLGNGQAYHGYLFNRSHLLAKSLGGENSTRNMITGTRTQNVGRNQPAGGMAYTETEARDWLDKHRDGSIQYDVTPNYTGDELIPRTNTVDIRSSDGTIDQEVTVFNTANGHDIDYTGKTRYQGGDGDGGTPPIPRHHSRRMFHHLTL